MATLPVLFEWNAAMIESFTNQVNHLPTWCLSCPPMPSCEKCWANEVFVPKRWLSHLGRKPYQPKDIEKTKEARKTHVKRRAKTFEFSSAICKLQRRTGASHLSDSPDHDWSSPRNMDVPTHSKSNLPPAFVECFTYSTPFFLDFETRWNLHEIHSTPSIWQQPI